jgi:transcriptional regulator with XRE-family HTH domain
VTHPISIGARIRTAREKRGVNKNQLARLLGTSWQHVHRWEIGRTAPSADSLQKIAKELGVSAGYLLGAEVEVATDESRGLELFLKSYAPDDLTEAEMAWLRAAPLGPEATAGRYVDLLEALRSGSGAASGDRAPTQSGTHAKADREAVLRRKTSG